MLSIKCFYVLQDKKGKQQSLPVIIEIKDMDKMPKKEIEDLINSAGKGLSILFKQGNLSQSKEGVLMNGELIIGKKINLDKGDKIKEELNKKDIKKKIKYIIKYDSSQFF